MDSLEIDKIRAFLQSGFWNEIMRPKLENRLRTRIKQLLLFPAERGDKGMTDDALRGAAEEVEWMLVAWQNEVAAFDINKRADELRASQESDLYGVTPANP